MNKRFACVLGSNGPAWDTRLEYAENDADHIRTTLEAQCGFTVSRARSNGDAHDAMREVLRVAALCRPGDDFVTYFSGHGVLHAGRLFLLWETTEKTIFDSAIPAKQVVEALELSAATNKLLILDCCHAGGAVGFKGNAALDPVLTDGAGSQLILCASSKLELAREFKTFKGSFLAFHISTILESKTRLSISLQDLVEQLKKRAVEHNQGNPLEHVPVPFLFGEDRAAFLIRRPKTNQAVEIRTCSFCEPDMDRFRLTIATYERWQPNVIRDRLPVEIAFPTDFVNRVQTLAQYGSTGNWPCDVSDEEKERLRSAAERLLPELKQELTRAVRMVCAAAFSESGDDLVAARDAVLETYFSAKLFATARTLNRMWLPGETREPWAEQFNELEPQHGSALILGLTWVSQNHYPCSFWTDADWTLGGRCRVFVPQKFGEGLFELHDPNFSQQDFWRLLVPQFVEAIIFYPNRFYETSLPGIMARKSRDLISYLTLRGEAFIETESHNRPNYSDAKRRATLIVAQKLEAHLKSLEVSKRDREYARITGLNVLDDLASEIQKLMPELRPEGKSTSAEDGGENQ